MQQAAWPAGGMREFKARLQSRMQQLAAEFGLDPFLMPVGLFMLLDEESGGDATAQELARRFKLLDFESKNVVDFYFLGWSNSGLSERGITFHLGALESCRMALRDAGIRQFGGNADLILLDAHYVQGRVTLDFSEAIRIDLSASAAKGDFPTLGGFLQSIIETAGEVSRSMGAVRDQGIVFAISDKLGLAIAKKSMLAFVLEKWGKVIGAEKLAALAVRNLGPEIDLNQLPSF